MNYSDNELIRLIQTAEPGEVMVNHSLHVLLIKHNKWIVSCAHRFSFSEIPFEDRYIACQLGFCKAIKTYDPAKGALSTWVAWQCMGTLVALRNEEYPWMEQAVEAPIHTDVEAMDEGQEDATVAHVHRPDGFNKLSAEMQADILFESFRGLKARDIEIFCHLHGILGYEELQGVELAEQYGVTPARITQITTAVTGLITKRITDTYRANEVI